MAPIIDHGAEEAARHGLVRSAHWPGVERAFKATSPYCAACDASNPVDHTGIQVHHIAPFHFCIAAGRPDLELDPRNLISLGETEHNAPAPNHHLLLGHLDDFKSYNLNVATDCETFRGMSTAEIEADSQWAATELARPLDEITPDELAAFRSMLDAALPPNPAILDKYGLTLVPRAVGLQR